jgi:hypothetical protein
MGCTSSKNDVFHANHIDDSVHVMLKHSAKAPGPHCYVPRAAHPLLDKKSGQNTVTSEEDCDDVNEALRLEAEESKKKEFLVEEDRLLLFAMHHNDLIDPRDLSVRDHEPKLSRPEVEC